MTTPTRSTRAASLARLPTATGELAGIFDAAERAPGDVVHARQNPDGSESFSLAMRRKPQAGGGLYLSRVMLPDLIGPDGRVNRTPEAMAGAETLRLDAALLRLSRVAQAGAHVVIVPEQDTAREDGPAAGVPLLRREESTFRVTNPANLGTVADDADALLMPWADIVKTSAVDWATAPIVGVQTVITRREQHTTPGRDAMLSELMLSLSLGLADAADRLLLAHIAAASPTAFTLAKAAAAGLRFGELRGIIGTAGTGAAVGQDGALRANGIAAELTSEAAGTIIGAFNRSAVFIRDRVDVLVERRDTAGRQRVTCWASLAPMAPTGAAHFWAGA